MFKVLYEFYQFCIKFRFFVFVPIRKKVNQWFFQVHEYLVAYKNESEIALEVPFFWGGRGWNKCWFQYLLTKMLCCQTATITYITLFTYFNDVRNVLTSFYDAKMLDTLNIAFLILLHSLVAENLPANTDILTVLLRCHCSSHCFMFQSTIVSVMAIHFVWDEPVLSRDQMSTSTYIVIEKCVILFFYSDRILFEAMFKDILAELVLCFRPQDTSV